MALHACLSDNLSRDQIEALTDHDVAYRPFLERVCEFKHHHALVRRCADVIGVFGRPSAR